MNKDAFDGEVQKKRGPIAMMIASAGGALVAGSVLILGGLLPEPLPKVSPQVARSAGDVAYERILRELAGPKLCPESMCSAIAGPMYTLRYPDAGSCNCVSRSLDSPQ